MALELRGLWPEALVLAMAWESVPDLDSVYCSLEALQVVPQVGQGLLPGWGLAKMGPAQVAILTSVLVII